MSSEHSAVQAGVGPLAEDEVDEDGYAAQEREPDEKGADGHRGGVRRSQRTSWT